MQTRFGLAAFAWATNCAVHCAFAKADLLETLAQKIVMGWNPAGGSTRASSGRYRQMSI
jgi:hypothetical protein